MKQCQIALVSFESQFAKPQKNLEHIVSWSRDAAKQNADMVCFPEIALQGYHDDAGTMRRQAGTLDGPVCAELRKVAAECGLVISLGMALVVDKELLNAQVFIDEKGVVGYSTKIHHGREEHPFFGASAINCCYSKLLSFAESTLTNSDFIRSCGSLFPTVIQLCWLGITFPI